MFMIQKSCCWIICFVVFFVSCTTNEKEKKEPAKLEDSTTNKATPDSVNGITSSTIEKEFRDSISIKPAKDSVLLKFNFQKGKTYNYTMMIDAVRKKDDRKMGTMMKWNYDMQVIDESQGLKTLKTTYKRIDMTMDAGNDQKMDFSSEKQVDAMDFMQMPSKMFGIIKGKSFTMQVDQKGQVVSVSGFDKIGETVITEMNLPDEMKPIIRQNFQKQFNDDAVKQMFSQSFNALPNKYVKVGDSWKANASLATLKQDISTVYTVRSIKGSRILLTGTAKLKSPEGQNTGTQTSKLIIDAKTGVMLDGVFDQKSTDGQMSTATRIIGKEI
jgi:hypothetical protein